MAELIFVRRGEEVMFYQLDGKTTRIGRGAENEIAFPEHEHYISRNHASIEERFGSFWLRDLTGQGIAVNENPVREAALHDGDRFEVGRWEIVFRAQSRGTSRTIVTRGEATMPLNDQASLGAEARAILSFEKGGATREVVLGQEPFHIGKEEQNDLSLNLSYISSFHCRIFFRDGRYFIRDLESLNKTYVNGAQVVESELPDGAEIYLGRFLLHFRTVEDESQIDDDEAVWPGFAGIVSEDPQMEKVFRLISRVAQTDAPALILGESGTGKELISRAIHSQGPRASQPFVALNCGALTGTTIESALFGHERGAFTGADQARVGAFEEAAEGTLFLDEIGDMPMEQQVALLRVLEGGTFRRMGGGTELHSRARVVAATHRDLVDRAEAGDFRQDLYYRISVLQIHLPSLRERPKDIPLLANFFLKQCAGPRILQFSQSALQRLKEHTWPGNVRELKNAITRAVVMAEGTVIEADDMILEDRRSREPAGRTAGAAAPAPREASSLHEAERLAILNALDSCDGVVSDAARMLGIGRSSMYSKMKRLGIEHRKK